MNVRKIAASSLMEWGLGHVYAESLVQRNSKKFKLSKEDRNLLNALIMGVVRNKSLLDYWIYELRKGKLDEKALNFLRVGLVQLFILKMQHYAAINETVEAAPKSLKGLVNAILRESVRKRDVFEKRLETLPIHIRYSHPEWLVQKWVEKFGTEKTIELMKWNQMPASIYAKINSLKVPSREKFLSSRAGSFESHDQKGHLKFQSLPPKDWIDEGLIYIQDPVTSMAPTFLNVSAGERVLDACAAPGGKAFQLAAAMGNKGKLDCTDSNAKRLPRLQENLTTLGVEIAYIKEHDWEKSFPSEWVEAFDAVLLDVPCSNTGVLRRRVDARWRMTPQDVLEVINTQKSILVNASKCIKKFGRIVYSTCSINSEENQEVVQHFLDQNPEFELEKEEVVLPQKSRTDGAYAALILKKG